VKKKIASNDLKSRIFFCHEKIQNTWQQWEKRHNPPKNVLRLHELHHDAMWVVLDWTMSVIWWMYQLERWGHACPDQRNRLIKSFFCVCVCFWKLYLWTREFRKWLFGSCGIKNTQLVKEHSGITGFSKNKCSKLVSHKLDFLPWCKYISHYC